MKMEKKQFFSKLEDILDISKTAVLSTVDSDNRSHMRWMTPVIHRDRPECIYCITSPDSDKVKHLENNNSVEWLISTPSLNEIIQVKGTIDIIDNPALKTEIIELIGHRLTVFWKVNPEKAEFVILETKINQAVHFVPMKGAKEKIDF